MENSQAVSTSFSRGTSVTSSERERVIEMIQKESSDPNKSGFMLVSRQAPLVLGFSFVRIANRHMVALHGRARGSEPLELSVRYRYEKDIVLFMCEYLSDACLNLDGEYLSFIRELGTMQHSNCFVPLVNGSRNTQYSSPNHKSLQTLWGRIAEVAQYERLKRGETNVEAIKILIGGLQAFVEKGTIRYT